jgi:hypothetical protein
MNNKVALFAFNGEAMCFVHVLLNALDMQECGYEVKVILEGSATKLANELNDPDEPFGSLYRKVRDAGLIDCACRACSGKMGALAGIQAQGLSLCDEMSGHPSVARYMEAGYEIVTF